MLLNYSPASAADKERERERERERGEGGGGGGGGGGGKGIRADDGEARRGDTSAFIIVPSHSRCYYSTVK